jgi:acetylornithine deacetylase
MTIEPWGAVLEDGRLLGRGSCDMKGGVAALLHAAGSLVRTGHGGEVQVALTADEEHSSLGMLALVAGGVRADAAVVCEPTELAVMPAHKGFIWVRAAFRGRAAHGSRPEIGVDAIRHAALYVAGLDEIAARLAARPPHPLLGRPSLHAGTIQGGRAPSVYPDRCEVVLERRTMPGEDMGEILREFVELADRLRNRIPELDVTVEHMLDRPGTEVPAESRLVRGLLAASALEGVEPTVRGMTAWVDAALLNEAGIPAVCFGPGSIARAHTDDEWVPADEIGRCARILERFARDFLNGP